MHRRYPAAANETPRDSPTFSNVIAHTEFMDRSTELADSNEIAAADLGEPVNVEARSAAVGADDRTGIALAAAAYGISGIVPIYWRLLFAPAPVHLHVRR